MYLSKNKGQFKKNTNKVTTQGNGRCSKPSHNKKLRRGQGK